MIDRRILLTSVAGVFGLAAMRWLKGSPARATEKFEIEKTDAEWRAQLTSQQYEILREQGTEPPWSSPLLKEHRKGIFACAGCDLSLFSSETIAAPAGRASTGRSTMRSPPRMIVASACCAPKYTAAVAAGISATSSTTGPSPPACATAWMVWHWFSIRPRRRQPDGHFASLIGAARSRDASGLPRPVPSALSSQSRVAGHPAIVARLRQF